MADHEDDEGDVLAGIPHVDHDPEGDGGQHNVERCPHCKRPMDEFEDMTEADLLGHIQTELLRDLARGFRNGTITHQEKAIVRGILRDNNSKVPSAPEPEYDPDIQEGHQPSPLPSEDEFPQGDYDATAGG